jgi:hypothetical protein
VPSLQTASPCAAVGRVHGEASTPASRAGPPRWASCAGWPWDVALAGCAGRAGHAGFAAPLRELAGRGRDAGAGKREGGRACDACGRGDGADARVRAWWWRLKPLGNCPAPTKRTTALCAPLGCRGSAARWAKRKGELGREDGKAMGRTKHGPTRWRGAGWAARGRGAAGRRDGLWEGKACWAPTREWPGGPDWPSGPGGEEGLVSLSFIYLFFFSSLSFVYSI